MLGTQVVLEAAAAILHQVLLVSVPAEVDQPSSALQPDKPSRSPDSPSIN